MIIFVANPQVMVYDNFFGAYVQMLKATRNFDPEGTSVFLVFAVQLLNLALLVAILQKSTGFSIVALLPSKYYILFLTIPWILILLKYYSKKRREKILENFAAKSPDTKLFWSIVSVASLVLPPVVFSILF